MISAGEFVQASGTWVNDRTHGVQFKASFLQAAPPTMIEGIKKYLGSGMIRGSIDHAHLAGRLSRFLDIFVHASALNRAGIAELL
jgi:hypothetical protein